MEFANCSTINFKYGVDLSDWKQIGNATNVQKYNFLFHPVCFSHHYKCVQTALINLWPHQYQIDYLEREGDGNKKPISISNLEYSKKGKRRISGPLFFHFCCKEHNLVQKKIACRSLIPQRIRFFPFHHQKPNPLYKVVVQNSDGSGTRNLKFWKDHMGV